MDAARLTTLLQGESARVEWKQSERDPKKVLAAICALANDLEDSKQSGFLVLGVDDKTGTATGLPYPTRKERDEAQQALENRIASISLVPQPSVSIHEVDAQGAWLLVVEVRPFPVPPVVRYEGSAFVRRGTVTRRATDADLQRLSERRPEGQLPFDQRTAAMATLADLDLSVMQREYDIAREADGDDTFPSFESWLVQRGVARRSAGGIAPTVAGVLLHALEPTTFFPGAAIDAVRYDGEDEESRLLVRKRLMGALPLQLDAAWALLDAWNEERLDPADGVRQGFSRDYPPDALKELVRNLVQHRSYEATNAPSRITWFSNRVELSNPGGPFGQASEGKFGEHADYRNPGITARLAELGYVQRLGRGVKIVRKQLERAGHPPLQVETDGFTTLIVKSRA